ncbi:MAG: cell wall hydrolase [Oscillospiraceae bacterium]|nr:cell wall hydrolase [Oscillospiraceae bacterium]
MKRLFIAIVVLAITTVTAQALLHSEGEEILCDLEQSPACAHLSDAEAIKTETGVGVCLRPMEPEALFYLEKWRAAAEYLLPEAYRLKPYVSRPWTDDCVAVISRMVWGEARGVSRNEQKLVVWTVINRLENGRYGNSLIGVVRARGQFTGYASRHPVTEAIRCMVIEVLEAWDRGEAAKVYPPFARTPYYLYFHGDGRHNWFRERHR